jgi:hypothetical protein
MRYAKGSVSLKFPDQQLLHVVADARYITHCQLFQLSRLKAFEFKHTTFNWRVRRLVKIRLLRKHVIPYAGTDALYSITRGGIQALEQMGVRFLGGGYVDRETDPGEKLISHVLELNRIRLALERSRTLVSWIPESLIRVLNLSPIDGYAKVYDAIVKVNVGDDVWTEFAIEYEQTLKNEERYAKIAEAIESEKRLDTILYLSSSYEIASVLRRHFHRTQRQILFAHLNDFMKDVLNTQVDFATMYRRMTLREALVHRAPSS